MVIAVAEPGVVAHDFNPRAQGAKRSGLSEFEVSLIYKASLEQPGLYYPEKPCLRTQNKSHGVCHLHLGSCAQDRKQVRGVLSFARFFMG